VVAVDHRPADVKQVDDLLQLRLREHGPECHPFDPMEVDVGDLFRVAHPITATDSATVGPGEDTFAEVDARADKIAAESSFTAYMHHDGNFMHMRDQNARFRSTECYVFLVKEWQDVEKTEYFPDESQQQELRSITAYFWQGKCPESPFVCSTRCFDLCRGVYFHNVLSRFAVTLFGNRN
jgi:hypothetical protein